MFRRWVAVILMTTCASSAFAGAWVQPKGKGLVIGQATYYSTEHYFDADGQEQPQPEFRKYELQPYGEYGLNDWLTVGGSTYLQRVSQSGGSNYGIADPEVFARARVWSNDKHVVSIQPLIKFGSRFNSENPPRGGSKSHDAELSVLYGRNFPVLSDRDYLDTRIGYRLRDNGLSNQWRSDVALGINVTDSIQIVPAVRAVVSTDFEEAAVFSENGELDYNVIKAEVTGIYHMNDTQWLQAGIFKHVAGIQTGSGYGVSLGFAERF